MEYEKIEQSCKCGYNGIAFLVDGGVHEGKSLCPECDGEMTFIFWDDVTDIDLILQDIEEGLESANYHSMGDIPTNIFYGVKEYLNDEQQLIFVKRLSEIFSNL